MRYMRLSKSNLANQPLHRAGSTAATNGPGRRRGVRQPILSNPAVHGLTTLLAFVVTVVSLTLAIALR